MLLGLTTGLAAAELALRVLPMTPASDVRGLHELRPDRPWLYGMRPGAEMRGPGGVRYQVNADGFRDHTYTRPKPAGTFRIVVLGHSVAFGWGSHSRTRTRSSSRRGWRRSRPGSASRC